jgi:hypothetical protein
MKKLFLCAVILWTATANAQTAQYVYRILDKNLKPIKTFYGDDPDAKFNGDALTVRKALENNVASSIFFLDGTEKVDLPFSKIEPNFWNKNYFLTFNEGSGSKRIYGLLDPKGNQILSNTFGSIYGITDGLVIASVDDLFYDYYDVKSGKIAVSLKYRYLGEFINGVAFARDANNNEIYINKKGEKTEEPNQIFDKLYIKKADDSLVYYSSSNNKRLFATHKYAKMQGGAFVNGKALLINSQNYPNSEYFIVNDKGVISKLPQNYGDYYEYEKGSLIYFSYEQSKYKIGICNTDGNKILTPGYEKLKAADFSQNRFIVSQKDIEGQELVDKKGNVLIKAFRIETADNGSYLVIEKNGISTDGNTITKNSKAAPGIVKTEASKNIAAVNKKSKPTPSKAVSQPKQAAKVASANKKLPENEKQQPIAVKKTYSPEYFIDPDDKGSFGKFEKNYLNQIIGLKSNDAPYSFFGFYNDGSGLQFVKRKDSTVTKVFDGYVYEIASMPTLIEISSSKSNPYKRYIYYISQYTDTTVFIQPDEIYIRHFYEDGSFYAAEYHSVEVGSSRETRLRHKIFDKNWNLLADMTFPGTGSWDSYNFDIASSLRYSRFETVKVDKSGISFYGVIDMGTGKFMLPPLFSNQQLYHGSNNTNIRLDGEAFDLSAMNFEEKNGKLYSNGKPFYLNASERFKNSTPSAACIQKYPFLKDAYIVLSEFTIMANNKYYLIKIDKATNEFTTSGIAYDIIEGLEGTMCRAKKEGKWGIVNSRTFDTEVPFKYDSIAFHSKVAYWENDNTQLATNIYKFAIADNWYISSFVFKFSDIGNAPVRSYGPTNTEYCGSYILANGDEYIVSAMGNSYRIDPSKNYELEKHRIFKLINPPSGDWGNQTYRGSDRYYEFEKKTEPATEKREVEISAAESKANETCRGYIKGGVADARKKFDTWKSKCDLEFNHQVKVGNLGFHTTEVILSLRRLRNDINLAVCDGLGDERQKLLDMVDKKIADFETFAKEYGNSQKKPSIWEILINGLQIATGTYE